VKNHYDVLVIGGGPAGSTAAALSARAGLRVGLLDQARFPREHIGESLPPGVLPVLDLLGVREKVEAHGFQVKRGAYFEWGGESWHYDFGDLTGQRINYSWQVIRSEFDELLLRHAQEEGVEVHEATACTGVHFEGGRAVAADWRVANGGGGGRITFDQLIDASGRAGILATKHLRTRELHHSFRNVAIWSYWRGGRPLPEGPEGAIAVISIPTGWFWYIPLHDGRWSVGVVQHKSVLREARKAGRSLASIYSEAIVQSPTVATSLKEAEQISSVQAETDYSYSMSRFAGPGWFAAGDAACFLDPLLSTGVHLAMFSAVIAAATITSVARGDLELARASEFYDHSYRRAYLRYLVLVSSFYRAYAGRSTYFWEAQQLVSRDCTTEDLGDAFLEIVSGIADYQESGQPLAEQVLEEVSRRAAANLEVVKQRTPLADMTPAQREQSMAKLKLMSGISPDLPRSPDTAIDGMWLELEPSLRVRRLDSVRSLTSSRDGLSSPQGS